MVAKVQLERNALHDPHPSLAFESHFAIGFTFEKGACPKTPRL